MAANKNSYVVDASVIAKWFLDEPEDKAQSEKLKADFVEGRVSLIVPAHFDSEMASIFHWKFKTGAINAYSHLKMLRIPTYSTSVELFAQANGLLIKKQQSSIYDPIYHALALEQGAKYITADEKYFKAAKQHGSILLLKNY